MTNRMKLSKHSCTYCETFHTQRMWKQRRLISSGYIQHRLIHIDIPWRLYDLSNLCGKKIFFSYENNSIETVLLFWKKMKKRDKIIEKAMKIWVLAISTPKYYSNSRIPVCHVCFRHNSSSNLFCAPLNVSKGMLQLQVQLTERYRILIIF